jgi:SAM-dependent methyltransferase
MTSTLVNAQEAISRDELRSLLLQYRRENWQGIQSDEVRATVVEQILQDDGGYVLNRVQKFFQIPAACRVLDIGSGVGTFVMGCRSRGIQAFGVEPDRIGQGSNISSLKIARRRTAEHIFVAGTGENLPFPNGSFDLVTMNQVIEHVSDQRACLKEAFRVLKPGGALYVACPNYLRFYEPHYKIAWLPLMPRLLGSAYLRMRGRNPVMLKQLTYTTNNRVRKLLQELPNCELIDLNEKQFLEKRAAKAFASRKYQLLGQMTQTPILGAVMLQLVLFGLRVRQGGCEMMVIRNVAS